MKTRSVLSLLIFLVGLSAHPSFATDPNPDDLRQRALDGYLVASSQMDEEEFSVVEELRALASSNPQFAKSEAILREAQDHWKQYSIKDCDFLAADSGAPAYEIKFTNCLTSYTQTRTQQLHGYVVGLQVASKEPGMHAPIPPIYNCSFTAGELASVSANDACMIRAVAERCDNEGDTCLVRCLATGGAKDIGGGCYHLCSRYGLRGTPWAAPAKLAACWPPIPTAMPRKR